MKSLLHFTSYHCDEHVKDAVIFLRINTHTYFSSLHMTLRFSPDLIGVSEAD